MALGVALLVLTVLLAIVHFALFHDARNYFFYLLLDLSFLPVEVLLVTLIIHR
jgi:hypothetical protein